MRDESVEWVKVKGLKWLFFFSFLLLYQVINLVRILLLPNIGANHWNKNQRASFFNFRRESIPRAIYAANIYPLEARLLYELRRSLEGKEHKAYESITYFWQHYLKLMKERKKIYPLFISLNVSNFHTVFLSPLLSVYELSWYCYLPRHAVSLICCTYVVLYLYFKLF